MKVIVKSTVIVKKNFYIPSVVIQIHMINRRVRLDVSHEKSEEWVMPPRGVTLFLFSFIIKNKETFFGWKSDILSSTNSSQEIIVGMEEIRVTHTVTYSHFLSFCHPCTLSLCKKIRFCTYLRDRTKENSFSFAWITSYNDRTTKKWLYLTVWVTRISSIPSNIDTKKNICKAFT
jgi:hypothetical protein